MTDEIESHLREIERHVHAIRTGETVDVTPFDFRLPTPRELAYLRNGCGFTQADVAGILGYSEKHVSHVESGQQAPGRKFIIAALRLYAREWDE